MAMASTLLPPQSRNPGPPPPSRKNTSLIGQGRDLTHATLDPARRPCRLMRLGLSGVSCGPRALGSGSPSTGHYTIIRQSCQIDYTITTWATWASLLIYEAHGFRRFRPKLCDGARALSRRRLRP